MPTYNHSEIADLEEHAAELAQEAETHRRLVDYNTAMLIAFEELAYSYQKDDGSVTTEKANMVMSAAMESLGVSSLQGNFNNLSLEDIQRHQGSFWDSVKRNIGLALKNTVDNVQTFVTLTNLQNSRLQKLKRSLATLDNDATATIKVPKSKYMTYGDNQLIEDSETYVKEYVKMAGVMKEFCSVASDLNNESKFNVAAYIGAKATFSGDEFVIRHFKRMYELVSKVVSANGMKKESTQDRAELYATDPLLGMSQIVARLPSKDIIGVNSYKKARDAVRYVYLNIDRLTKFELPSDGGSVELTFTKKQINTLIQESEELLNEANALLTLTKKFNLAMDVWLAKGFYTSYGAVGAAGVAAIAMNTKNSTNSGQLPATILPAIRIILRYMNMTFDCTAGGYNSSIGNIKKALSITESFIKKAD